MIKKRLTVGHLMRSGFSEVGTWSGERDKLKIPAGLPLERGVYAFAIGDQVNYVGLASRSLKQRLSFYARPGSSQRTNLRLNSTIRELINVGASIRIFIAHPPDGEWNGLRVSGPEGLEAALIEDFDLPWNLRGAKTSKTPIAPAPPMQGAGPQPDRRQSGATAASIVQFVRDNPDCTEIQIARAVFGPDALQPRANTYCRRLVQEGLIERKATRPCTYVACPVATDPME